MRISKLLLILFIISCNQKQEIIGEDYEVEKFELNILTHGLRDFQLDRASNTIAHKYGFNYLSVASCTVDENIYDSLTIENTKTKRILENKLGQNWDKNLKFEITSMVEVQRKIDSLVFKNKRIIQFRATHKEIEDIFTNIEFASSTNLFNVDVVSWRDDGKKLKRYFRLLVNISNDSIEYL